MTPVVETPRLVLRRFTEADAPLLFDLDSDPEVMRFVGPFGFPTVEGYIDLIRTRLVPGYAVHPGRGCLAVHEKPGLAFAGWVFLRPAPDCRFAADCGWDRPTDLEVGYRLRRSAWGRGLATEAALALVEPALADPAVTGVVGVAMAANAGSRRVLEKCGLRFVRHVTLHGATEPDVMYARYTDGGPVVAAGLPGSVREDG